MKVKVYHDLMVGLNEVQEQYEILGGYNYQGETEKILIGLGFKREDFRQANRYLFGRMAYAY